MHDSTQARYSYRMGLSFALAVNPLIIFALLSGATKGENWRELAFVYLLIHLLICLTPLGLRESAGPRCSFWSLALGKKVGAFISVPPVLYLYSLGQGHVTSAIILGALFMLVGTFVWNSRWTYSE